jgi:hypothetical protein
VPRHNGLVCNGSHCVANCSDWVPLFGTFLCDHHIIPVQKPKMRRFSLSLPISSSFLASRVGKVDQGRMCKPCMQGALLVFVCLRVGPVQRVACKNALLKGTACFGYTSAAHDRNRSASEAEAPVTKLSRQDDSALPHAHGTCRGSTEKSMQRMRRF